MHKYSRSRNAQQNVFLPQNTEFLKLKYSVALHEVSEFFSKVKRKTEHDVWVETKMRQSRFILTTLKGVTDWMD